MIRSIDKDRNGYITSSELDDILKEVYPDLKNKDLKRLIRRTGLNFATVSQMNYGALD